MKALVFREIWLIIAGILMLSLPGGLAARTEGAQSGPPPIAQALVREGDFAVRLTAALGLGSYQNEAAAESRLGDVGIVPRNGWIADYPVTPDIVGELEKSVGDAADAGRIALSRDEALAKLAEVNAGVNLAVTSYAGDQRSEAPPADAAVYPDQAGLVDYYASVGPPVVTYYAPPPDYSYLYSWVPSPFWWTGVWFSGFFVLNDFHRQVFVGHQPCFVSNHFHDVAHHRVFRIDPAGRFHGQPFVGAGGSGGKRFDPAGMPRGGQHFATGSRPQGNPAFRNGGRPATVSSSGTRTTPAMWHGGTWGTRTFSGSGGRMVSQTHSGGSRMSSPASFGSGGRGWGGALHTSFGGSSGRSGGMRR